MVNVLIDIDGVLAWGNIPHLASMYSEILKLDIPKEQLKDIETRDVFYALPQIKAHIEDIGEERYQRQIARMEWHPLYVLKLNVMEGAVAGVRYLGQKAQSLGYCTARVINFNDSWNEHLARVTKAWLKENDFPHADEVIFCDGIKAKIDHILASIKDQEQPTILIDDSVEKLLMAVLELPEDDQAVLRKYLTIAAFGYEECPDGCPLQVIPFPDWGEVIGLSVEKEFDYVKPKRSSIL